MPQIERLYHFLTLRSLHFGEVMRTLLLKSTMMPLRSLCLAFCLVGASPGCAERPVAPPPPIERGTFVRLTADRMILEEEWRLSGSQADSSVRLRRLDSLYAAYHCSRGMVETTQTWYRTDAVRWKEVNDLTAKRLEQLEQQTRAALGR